MNSTGNDTFNPKHFARLLSEFDFCNAKVTSYIEGTFYFYHVELYVTVVRDPKNYRIILCLTIKAP